MGPCLSPKIEDVSWGRIRVAGHGEFKDVKIYPDGARTWDWRENGTHHRPGIQPGDVDELLCHGASEIVLSRGMWLALQVMPETLRLLREKDIPVHVLETRMAVVKFNELRERAAVGGLFHSTC